MEKEIPPIRDVEDFKKRVKALPQAQQVKIFERLYDLIYDKLDDQVWRTMATAIKHAKDTGMEGHEKFDIEEKDLKKLSHIQDSFRRKDK